MTNNLETQIEKYILTINQISRAGNLSARFDTDGDSKLSELGLELNQMMDKIETILSDVSNLTKQLNKASLQIMSSVAEQNSVANQQASSVTEITSTMEELSATSRQIAMNSSSVLSLAEEGVQTTENGVEKITQLQKRMMVIDEDNQNNSKEIIELGKKSGEISKVMEIIKGIADQTKLIAFNAALEAASAGESGKRFGIVAVEIRRLADSVTESTKEIAENITEIQKTVNELVISSEKSSTEIDKGVMEADVAGSTLKKILESAHANADAAKQISTSTQQQNTASNQVVMAIKEISSGANSNMKSVQESGENIEMLAKMAVEMEKKVGEFELGEMNFDWHRMYHFDIESIDAEHKALLNNMNSYYKIFSSEGIGDKLEQARTDLLSVCQKHFEHEEELFAKFNYSDSERHIQEHQDFIKFLEKYANPREKQKDLILNKMKKWASKHILISDRGYVEIFKSNTVE